METDRPLAVRRYAIVFGDDETTNNLKVALEQWMENDRISCAKTAKEVRARLDEIHDRFGSSALLLACDEVPARPGGEPEDRESALKFLETVRQDHPASFRVLFSRWSMSDAIRSAVDKGVIHLFDSKLHYKSEEEFLSGLLEKIREARESEVSDFMGKIREARERERDNSGNARLTL